MKYVYALGVSQSGRFLRDYLYEGFNTDEKQRQVFDGMMVHIAGASQLDLNRRWATPTGLGEYAATLFPFADRAQKDAASGATDGLLDNDRARANLPKIFYTNTGVEYLGGGRTAALIHTTADGTTDLNLPANVRSYFFAGNQHGPGAFPPAAGAGQQKGNPTDYWWSMRALFVAMDKWVREGARRHPATFRGCRTRRWSTPPTWRSPRSRRPDAEDVDGGFARGNLFVPGGAGEGAPLPLLVPQVDADGNERSGIRLPEVAVPRTYTGWNFRSAATGGTSQLVPLLGSYIPLARTKVEREARHDPAAVDRGAVRVEAAISRRDRQVRCRAGQGRILARRGRPGRRQACDRPLGVRDA